MRCVLGAGAFASTITPPVGLLRACRQAGRQTDGERAKAYRKKRRTDKTEGVQAGACACTAFHCVRHVRGGGPQSEDAWDAGPEQGGLARTQAARLVTELAGDSATHAWLAGCGATDAVAARAEELVRQMASPPICALYVANLQIELRRSLSEISMSSFYTST
jgi:hypothetical protein